MKEEKWARRRKQEQKRKSRKPDSGRSVFTIQRLQQQRSCKHDYIEALPPPHDLPCTPDVCAKCGKEKVFKR